jgi:hypothetical protein
MDRQTSPKAFVLCLGRRERQAHGRVGKEVALRLKHMLPRERWRVPVDARHFGFEKRRVLAARRVEPLLPQRGIAVAPQTTLSSCWMRLMNAWCCPCGSGCACVSTCPRACLPACSRLALAPCLVVLRRSRSRRRG